MSLKVSASEFPWKFQNAFRFLHWENNVERTTGKMNAPIFQSSSMRTTNPSSIKNFQESASGDHLIFWRKCPPRILFNLRHIRPTLAGLNRALGLVPTRERLLYVSRCHGNAATRGPRRPGRRQFSETERREYLCDRASICDAVNVMERKFGRANMMTSVLCPSERRRISREFWTPVGTSESVLATGAPSEDNALGIQGRVEYGRSTRRAN
uniref:Uncharacterized protein n=1 Tax=Steinernema glaseri TaxID=37863 RepID=A0A1I8A9Y0_9BILA